MLKDKIYTFLTNIDIASEDNKLVPYFLEHSEKIAGEVRQRDLAYGTGLLVADGADTQSNGYYFKRDLLLQAYKTILLKPINIEHQSTMFVGSVYDVVLARRPEDSSNRYNVQDYIIDDKDVVLNEKTNKWEVKGYSGPIDMWIGFILYKYLFPEVYEYVIDHKFSISNSSTNKYKLGLSMEMWYGLYGYLFDLDEKTIQEKDIENAYLDEYIGRMYNGKKVYKVYLEEFIFAAAALTETAAENRSFLLDVANKSIEKDTQIITLYNVPDDLKDLSTVEINPELYDNPLNMTKELFISLKDAATEEHDENLVKEILDLDLAVRAKERDEGQTKYKDVPVSRFAEPASYKYPLNTPSRVRASVMYFSQHGDKYSVEEQQKIWGKILKAAAKFELSITDKVVGKDRSSTKNPEEVANMEELLKQLKAQFEVMATQLQDMAKNNTLDEASVKNLLATEKLNTIMADLEEKQKQLKDVSAATAAQATELEEIKAANETLTSEKADLASQIEANDKEIEEMKKAKEEADKVLETANDSITEFEKEGLVKGRLTALKADGVVVDETRVDSVVEKASTYSDEDWTKYVENLKDVAATKVGDKKKDISSQATSLTDIGKNILLDKKGENSTTKDNASAPGSPDGDDGKSMVDGFEKNFTSNRKPKV